MQYGTCFLERVTPSLQFDRYPGIDRFRGPFPNPIGTAVSRVRFTHALAPPTASTGVSPRSSRHNKAEENAHPVPWVEVVSIRSPENHVSSPSTVRRKSSGG